MNRPFVDGVLLVAQQDVRTRLRTGRWRYMLGAWAGVVVTFTVLLDVALGDLPTKGLPLFGGLMLFVLALTLIVSPAFTAQSINGDRERGTLAPLQITALRPGQIAAGKLLAGWSVGLSALGLTLPCVGWCLVRGGVGPLRIAVAMAVVAMLICVVCAVSQAISALLARSITSALVSYLAVAAVTIGTVIAFGFSTSLLNLNDGGHPGNTWWILAPNPFIVLADATPRLEPNGRTIQVLDPLGSIGTSLRSMRRSADHDADCVSSRCDTNAWIDEYAIWPYGLAVNLAIGAGALMVTTSRLRTPYTELPHGVRVA